jgi:agmatine deiminase
MAELPGEAGYRLPAEHEPHASTWMAWPHDERTWIAGLEEARDVFLAMIEALSHGERVHLVVRPQDRREAEDRLSTRTLGEVRLHEKDHADAWLRDTGPTVLVDGQARLAVDWRFDAWGGKYEDLKRDDDVAAFVADREGIDRVRVDEVCEGGAFDADGQGTLMTTAACLVEGRGHASKRAVETLFERVLGAEDVIWLHGGLRGDDTDGHVDTVARFVAEDRVALAAPGRAREDDRELLAANCELVQAAGLDVIELPQPAPVEVRGSSRPATYANFYVGNEAVLLPTYEDPNDDAARRRLAEAFPDRRVVEIPAGPLIAGYGACHCLTQPIPAPEPA